MIPVLSGKYVLVVIAESSRNGGCDVLFKNIDSANTSECLVFYCDAFLPGGLEVNLTCGFAFVMLTAT